MTTYNNGNTEVNCVCRSRKSAYGMVDFIIDGQKYVEDEGYLIKNIEIKDYLTID